MQSEANDKNMMMQDLTKQMATGQHKELEKDAEIDKLNLDIKKL